LNNKLSIINTVDVSLFPSLKRTHISQQQWVGKQPAVLLQIHPHTLKLYTHKHQARGCCISSQREIQDLLYYHNLEYKQACGAF